MEQHLNALLEKIEACAENIIKVGKLTQDTRARVDALSGVITTLQHLSDTVEQMGTKIEVRRYEVWPTQSEQAGEIYAALSQAKPQIKIHSKTGTSNRGTYISIDDMLDAVLPVFKAYGLTLDQYHTFNEHAEDILVTKIGHTSGQWVQSVSLVRPELDKGQFSHQKLGAALSYVKRYDLYAILGVGRDTD